MIRINDKTHGSTEINKPNKIQMAQMESHIRQKHLKVESFLFLI